MRDDLLTSRQAAKLLGVGATSIKRWSDEGLLACVKTAGRHRRFERAVVLNFRGDGRRSGGAGAASAGEGSGAPTPWLELLVRRDDPHAVEARLLEERARLGRWWRVAELLGATLRELGERWAAGALSIVDEHLASERLGRGLARVCEWLPVAASAPAALLATTGGEEHTLGLALAEVCLREAGWRTLGAGRRMPADALAAALAAGSPAVRMVALSASLASSNRRALATEARHIGAACRRAEIALVVGGDGAWPERLSWGVRLRSLERLHHYAREQLDQ